MKKSTIIISVLATITLIGIIFAQTTTTLSIVEKMKAASHDFTLTTELNAGQTNLKSGPLSGKLTGGMVTAEEYNRMLEMLGEQFTGNNSGTGGGTTCASQDQKITFNGTTATVLNKTPGITGVTRNSTGRYTINFTTPMANTNYHVLATSSYSATNNAANTWVCGVTKNTSSVGIDTCDTPNGVLTFFDSNDVNVLISLDFSGTACGAGGSSSGFSMLPGWPDAIVCTASDEKNVIFYNSGENANASEVIYFTRFSSAPGWFMRFNPDKSFKTGESKFDCNGKSIQQLIDAKKTFNFVGGGGGASAGGGGASNTCRWVNSATTAVTGATPQVTECAADEYVRKVRTHQVNWIANSTYKTVSDLYCCKFGQ